MNNHLMTKKKMVLWWGYTLSVLIILLSEIVSLYFGSKIIHQSSLDLFDNFIFFIGYIFIIAFFIIFFFGGNKKLLLVSLAIYIFSTSESIASIYNLLHGEMASDMFGEIIYICTIMLDIFQSLAFIIWLILVFLYRHDYIEFFRLLMAKLKGKPDG